MERGTVFARPEPAALPFMPLLPCFPAGAPADLPSPPRQRLAPMRHAAPLLPLPRHFAALFTSLRAALLLLLLCPFAYPAQEIDDAAEYNMGLAPSLLGAKNPCGAAESRIGENDVFSVAGVRLVTVMPMANNVTSDLSSPKVLWSWFAVYPERATFATPSEDGCPAGKLEIYNPGNPALKNAALRYKYGSLEREVPLASAGPNPVVLDLNGSRLAEDGHARLYANLSLKLEGEIAVEYDYRKTAYRMVCRTGEAGTFCGCEPESTGGRRRYVKEVGDARGIHVETGPVEEVWLSPPLQTRLSGNQKGKLLIFARRMPAKINISVGGRELGWSEPYRFSVADGGCGEKTVSGYFAPMQQGLAVGMNETAVFPLQLVEKNAPYLPFYLEFGWREAAGGKEVSVEYEDWFSHTQNFTREFSVREPAAFSLRGEEGADGIRFGSDSLSPAFYPAEEKPARLPDFSPLAALVALPFFGAVYFLFRRLGRKTDGK